MSGLEAIQLGVLPRAESFEWSAVKIYPRFLRLIGLSTRRPLIRRLLCAPQSEEVNGCKQHFEVNHNANEGAHHWYYHVTHSSRRLLLDSCEGDTFVTPLAPRLLRG